MNIMKYYKNLPYLLIVSAFGVYLGFGLRIEHLVLYPSVLFFLFISIYTKQKVIKNYFCIFVLWLFVVITAVLVTLGVYNGETQISKILADTESFIQPLALMILFMFLTLNLREEEVVIQLQKASQVLIFMLSLNSIFIIISLFTNISYIGNFFWGGEDWSVAARAMTNGRFSGIFNQPMEAGAMYSIGLLAWLYLSEKIKIFKIKYIVSLFLMVIGGLITVSKVFLFGGLPLFFVGVILNKKIWRLLVSLTFWSVVLGYVAYYFLLKTWTGLDYLFRFFDSNEDFLTLITAERYGGNNSQQLMYFKDIWNDSPLYGRGFGVTPTYDSGYYQFFAIGGSIGFSVFIVMLLAFLVLGLKFLKQNHFKSESKLYLSLVILIIGSSLGSPTLTLNRVTIVLWVFIGTLFQFFYVEKTRIKNKKINS